MNRRAAAFARTHSAADAGPSSLKRSPPKKRSLLKFFLLVFALSAPFWLIGSVTALELMPGLPISSLAAICPMLAALLLVYKDGRAAAVAELLKRSFDYKRIPAKGWYVAIVLLMPGVSALVYGLMHWMDLPLPPPRFPTLAQTLAAPLMFLAFFVGALGEELGWSGYAIGPMQERWNALQASIVLGLVGAMWHLVPLVQAHRSLAWIAWWCLYAVSARVLIVRIYNRTGKSVFATALFHAMLNVSWMLFPVYGSHFDVRLGGLVMAALAATVTLLWGAKTPAQARR